MLISHYWRPDVVGLFWGMVLGYTMGGLALVVWRINYHTLFTLPYIPYHTRPYHGTMPLHTIPYNTPTYDTTPPSPQVCLVLLIDWAGCAREAQARNSTQAREEPETPADV